MSRYILSCMLAAALDPTQHPVPLECERAYVSLEQCQKAQRAVESKWAPICYTRGDFVWNPDQPNDGFGKWVPFGQWVPEDQDRENPEWLPLTPLSFPLPSPFNLRRMDHQLR
jgi:hypothetical protein